MKYPKKFYLEKTIQTECYETTASDTLDAERYIQGQPCFLHEKEIRRLVKKKIILYNWGSIININLTHREQRNLVHGLLDDGFEVYATLSLSHMLVKLDKRSYDTLFYRDDILSNNSTTSIHTDKFNHETESNNLIYLTTKTLLSAAEDQLSAPSSEVMILDELTAYICIEKIPETESIEFSFNTGDGFRVALAIEQVKNLMQINPDDYRRIKQFNLCASSKSLNLLKQNIKQIQAYLMAESSSVNVLPKLNDQSFKQMVLGFRASSTQTSEERDETNTPFKRLYYSKKISISYNAMEPVSEKEILDIIDSQSRSQTIELDIKDFQNIQSTEINKIRQKGGATELSMSIDSNHNDAPLEINGVLKALPRLESLKLSLNSKKRINLPVIPSLKSLSITMQSITYDLPRQLRNFENLEFLSIEVDKYGIYLHDDDTEINLKHEKLPKFRLIKLKHLELINFPFNNMHNLESLLALTPNLETLVIHTKLKYPRINFMKIIHPTSDQLNTSKSSTLTPKLKSLSFFNFNISIASDFNEIFSGIQLEQLNFESCTFSTSSSVLSTEISAVTTKELSLLYCHFESHTLSHLIKNLGQSLTSLFIKKAKILDGNSDEATQVKAPNTLRAISFLNSKAPQGLKELIASSSLTHLLINSPISISRVKFRESGHRCLVITSRMLERQPTLASMVSTLIINIESRDGTYDFDRINLGDSPLVKKVILNFAFDFKKPTESTCGTLRSLGQLLNQLHEIEILIMNFNIHSTPTNAIIELFNDPLIKPLAKLKHIHLNIPRYLSPTPSRLLQIAPNLELIQYKDLEFSENPVAHNFNLSDTSNRDKLPPSLPNLTGELDWDESASFTIDDHRYLQPVKHDPSHYNEPFKVDLKNRNDIQSPFMSQDIIILKFARYLELKNRLNKAIEEKLTLLICSSLAHLYQSQRTDTTWGILISCISKFTGKEEQLNQRTCEYFEQIYASFMNHNASGVMSSTERYYFIGGEIRRALSSLEDRSSTIFSNLDHAICVRKRSSDEIYIYDPNMKSGRAKLLSLEESIDYITKYSLGKIVFSEKKIDLTPQVLSLWKSTNEFIADGGLIALCRSQELLDYYKSNHQNDRYLAEYCIRALNIGGTEILPSALSYMTHQKTTHWLLEQILKVIFDNKSTSYCKDVIDLLFIKFHTYNFIEKSIIMSQFEKKDGLFKRILNDEVIEYTLQSYLSFPLESPTFINNSKHEDTRQDQIEILSNDINSQVISFTELNTLNTYTLALQAKQIREGKPVFTILEDIDLDLNANQLTRDENNRALIKTSNHPLQLFLNQNKENKDALLIINCEELSLSMISKYEEIFSSHTNSGIRTIVLISDSNEKLPALQDQIEIFEYITPCNIESSTLNSTFDRLVILPCQDINKKDYVVDLYNSKLWKQFLLGQWQIINNTLVYREGMLALAIESGKSIVLANAPWHDSKFIAFINQAHMNGQINNAGRLIAIPANTQWKAMNGYSHLHLTNHISVKQGFDASAPILNPYTLRSFYSNYTVDRNSKALVTTPGIIEEYAATDQKILTVTLSHPLSDDELARLVTTCAKHGLTLEMYTLENTDISSLVAVEETSYTFQNQNNISLYVTDDYDALTLKLTSQHQPEKQYTVFNVTGRNSDDLLDHIIAEPVTDKQNHTSFQFRSIKGAINQALESGEYVILKGEFSSQLAQALAPWLLDPQFRYANQLILITNSANDFNYMSRTHLDIEQEEKLTLLSKELNLPLPENASLTWKNDTLSTMRAKLIYATTQDSTDPWQGLNHLDICVDSNPLDMSTFEAEALDFNNKRYQSIIRVLKYSPFVFIAGITGVGKTMFINSVLKKHKVHVFNEASNIEAWAKSREKGLKVLFLDEFNIGTNEGDEFEDLFNERPSILHPKTHERLELTKEHKVIFAGNPISYSLNRHMPRFIDRHGCSVIFEPITPAYLFKTILKPLFKKHPALEIKCLEICEPILAVYRYACSISQDEVVLTPRELSMMAMLTITAYESNQSINPIEAARHYAHTIARPLIPNDYQAVFDSHFKQATPQHSHDSAYFIIEDMTKLRSLRQTHASDWSKKMKQTGLGGLILHSHRGDQPMDFIKGTLANLNIIDPVYISKSTKAAAAKNQLIKAFNEGRVVVIEEIGRSPMLEHCLNSLLMGFNPDTKNPAQTPGFMVLGTHTQTDGLYQTRLSSALMHRMVNVDYHSTMLIPEPQVAPKPEPIPQPESEPVSEVTIEEFKAAYKKARAEELFKKPWGGMFGRINDETQITSMSDVENYTKRKPHSLAAKVLEALRQPKSQTQPRKPKT